MEKLFLLSLSIVLVGAGCLNNDANEFIVGAEVVDSGTSEDVRVDEDGLKTFSHDASGLSFKYPADNVVFWNVDFETETMTPATSDSNGAAIVENKDDFFSGDVSAVGITYPEGYTVEDWIENGLIFWMELELIIKQNDIEFEGREAVEIIGPGDETGLYKVILVPDGENLIVIRQDRDDEFLNKIFDTIEFR